MFGPMLRKLDGREKKTVQEKVLITIETFFVTIPFIFSFVL